MDRMVDLPKRWQNFALEAEKLLADGAVQEIAFSGPTYQVQVGEEWAFLQLNSNGRVKDAFCSCESDACLHLAAAFLRIHQGTNQPLHERYSRSFWYHWIYAFGKEVEFENEIPENLKLTGKEWIQSHLTDRVVETEETSLKFSNLTDEEIEKWRLGTPSPELQFELSFWGDLSKSLFLFADEGEKYELTYKELGGLPLIWKASFPDLQVEGQLSKEEFSEVIPSLSTVKSPLKAHIKAAIYSIEYDPDLDELLIHGEKTDRSHGKEIPGWLYVSGEGFFPDGSHGLFGDSLLKGAEISDALDQNAVIIGEHLKTYQVNPKSFPLQYHLEVDEEGNFHIEGYLFEKGDIKRDFGRWAFLEGKGFQRVGEREFDEIKIDLSKDEVINFITQHRAWLNLQPGFTVHVKAMEAEIGYRLNDRGTLIFTSTNPPGIEKGEFQDYGRFLYIEEEGFYPTSRPFDEFPIKQGIPVYQSDIPLFIRVNYEDLKTVKGFFNLVNPIVNSGLRIELDEDEHIHVWIDHERRDRYKDTELRFFGDFVYVSGEGFSPLPINPRIPSRFRESCLISRSTEEFFLGYELAELEPYAFTIDPRLQIGKSGHLLAESIERDKQGNYNLVLSHETDLGVALAVDLLEAKRRKRRFAFTNAGLLDLSSEEFRWLDSLNAEMFDSSTGRAKLSGMELLRLHAFSEIETVEPRSEEILKNLFQHSSPKVPATTGLTSTLRPYQETGLSWLWHLYHLHLGALLCDDMGLGKTHQAMALLAAVPQKKRRHLIVCPTSVLYHWQDKLHEFLPDARVCTYYGIDRHSKDVNEDYDILLTSYGVWRIDSKSLSKMSFDVAIFDEIQAAKNTKSQLNRALRKVNARMRVGLTGTPIENELRELKALFDLVLPGYMPGEAEFRNFFVRPIERHQDPERQEMLRKFINPFVLRRKKSDVLDDLPEKVEEIAHCPLLDEQRKLYQQVLVASRQKILDQMVDNQAPIPYMHVFAALSKLKQICNHPAVYHQNPSQYKHHESGKWNLFVELLNEARNSGQKVVVFSQYLGQLDIIQAYLSEHEIGYATIRGATLKRGEEVRRFQTDPKCEVFVGSLQAAGVGIDLTAASVVIHYDRWWNAAKENQATDRVHRIGQLRGVQVFKLMTRGTFEERIDEMIRSKARLMEQVVQADEQQVVKYLTRDEIAALLEDVEFTSEDML